MIDGKTRYGVRGGNWKMCERGEELEKELRRMLEKN